MKEFRYVINNEPCAWQKVQDVTIEKMETIAHRLNKWYGNNWNIEYR